MRILAQAALLILVASAASTQDENARSTQVVRSNSTLIIVPTLVRSQSGEPIRGLDANRFRLTDNGKEQNIYLEEVENQPLAMVVLIQTGGAASSELGNYNKLDSVMGSVLGASPSKLAFVSFDSHVREIWAFPPRIDGLDYAMTHQEPGDSGAAVLDAIHCGINLLQNQPAQYRRIILLLSQEQDSGSESNSTDVLRDVARSGTTIYSFTFPRNAVRRQSPKVRPSHRRSDHTRIAPSTDPTTVDVAAESGGESLRFIGENDLDQKLSAVGGDIRNGYILSFRPNSTSLGLHTVRVQVMEQAEHFEVLARKIYWLD